MSALQHRPMTLAEFLEWEERQPVKHEFDGFRPIAMTGGTTTHARIQRNLSTAIDRRLVGKPCEFLGSDVKLEVAGRIRYPDGFVTCSNLSGETLVHRDPVVIFEIQSPSTASTDHFAKNAEYAATPSVMRYIILAQDAIRGTLFERVGGDWLGHILAADAVLIMPEIGIEVPLAEFYRGVEFAQADEPPLSV
jgi:Uma2 family endonuclease